MNDVSIYTQAGKCVKKILGIKDISLFRKNIHKKLGKLIYRQKYYPKDIINVMADMGVVSGSVVCIHASMREFYNYVGTAHQLIDEILKLIGKEGTLLMPAFPLKSLVKKPGYVFDLKEDPTGAGFLAEEFRKYPGVKRSINVQHSVCAFGKYAEYLVKDHHNTHDCWDKNSPWQRMVELDAIVINLGMPDYYIGTFDHCVESILQYEHPYWAQFFTKEVEYMYYDENGEIQTYKNYTCEIDRRSREKRVTKYFSDKEMSRFKLSNLLIKSYKTRPCLNKMLSLGRKGIGIYYIPTPNKFVFK